MSLSRRFFYFLLPSLVGTVASFVMLPLTTARLEAADFGCFALLGSVGMIISAFSNVGSSFLWAAFHPGLEATERVRFVSAITAVCLTAAVLPAVAIWLAAEHLLKLFPQVSFMPGSALLLVLTGAVLSVIWNQAMDMLMLEGRSKPYALAMIGARISEVGVTLALLYPNSHGVMALFWGLLAGHAVRATTGVILLRHYLRPVLARRWLRRILRKGVPTMPGNILEAAGTFCERGVLSAGLSLGALGVYTHSETYRNMTQMLLKSLARTIWPISLQEVRDGSETFPQTQAAWKPLFLLLALAGIACSAVSHELIALLTNGKFVAAAPFATAWFIFMVIQNTGKVPTAILCHHQATVFLANSVSATNLLRIGLLYLGVRWFGAWGAISLFIAQVLLLRVLLHLRAARLQRFHASEAEALWAVVVITAALFMQVLLVEALPQRLAAAALLSIFCLYTQRQTLQELRQRLATRRDVTELAAKPTVQGTRA